MNVDDLIYKVHKNPPIWDKRIKDHANRGIVDACWKKISTSMKIEEYLLRKKWKYLRDQFSTEFYKKNNRAQKNASDSAAVQKWQYFNQLLFLKDVINPLSRRSSRNPNPTSDEEDDVNPILDLECVVVNGPEEEPDPIEENEYQPPEILNGSASFPTSQPVNKRRHLRAEDTFYNKKILLEQENSSTQQYVSHHEPDNDDLLFLKSLLPFVSNIPLDRKLRFRSQVLNLVEEFTSPHSPAGPNPKPSSAPSTNCYENMSGEAEGYHMM